MRKLLTDSVNQCQQVCFVSVMLVSIPLQQLVSERPVLVVN